LNRGFSAVKPTRFQAVLFDIRVMMMEVKMTVIFESPYWVGIFEKIEMGQYQAARYMFGAEPTEPQLLRFALNDYLSLQFSEPVPYTTKNLRQVNYKRRMREIRAQMETPRKSTRAQETIKQEYETRAQERKRTNREYRISEDDRKYQIRKVRKAEKHRGH
jgi:hypothetical protein